MLSKKDTGFVHRLIHRPKEALPTTRALKVVRFRVLVERGTYEVPVTDAELTRLRRLARRIGMSVGSVLRNANYNA